VSYPAMMLSCIIDAEITFMNSEEFLKMKARQSKAQFMQVISDTNRSGRCLPMFAPHHRIQPPTKELEKKDEV